MEEDKNSNRRRKSIMVIDKKGQAKEVSKEFSDISTMIESTDKTKKTKANIIQNSGQEKNEIGNNDLSNSKLINKGLLDDNKDTCSESGDKKTLSLKSPSNKYRNVEIAAGAEAGEASGILNNEKEENENLEEEKVENCQIENSENLLVGRDQQLSNEKHVSIDERHISIDEKDKHVTINEQINEEHEVSNDGKSLPLTDNDRRNLRARSPNKSLNTEFAPQRIPSNYLHEGCGILEERENNNVEAEGHFYKRRRIFACFWHEKYFLLTKTGILKYYKANGTKVSKGNWNLKDIQRIHEIFMGGESHPFRLALMNGDENILFGFDDSENREYWLIKLSKYINK